MYLYKRSYVKNWEHTPKERRHSITVKRAGKKVASIDPKKIAYIIEDAGYWRKANHIHKWFVDNVQDGNDDCKEYYVSSEKLKELLDTCQQVLKASKLVKGKVYAGTKWEGEKEIRMEEDGMVIEDSTVANDLLPTEDGFFFGGTDYDEWYLKDVEDTVKILEDALANEEAEYYYSSSW